MSSVARTVLMLLLLPAAALMAVGWMNLGCSVAAIVVVVLVIDYCRSSLRFGQWLIGSGGSTRSKLSDTVWQPASVREQGPDFHTHLREQVLPELRQVFKESHSRLHLILPISIFAVGILLVAVLQWPYIIQWPEIGVLLGSAVVLAVVSMMAYGVQLDILTNMRELQRRSSGKPNDRERIRAKFFSYFGYHYRSESTAAVKLLIETCSGLGFGAKDMRFEESLEGQDGDARFLIADFFVAGSRHVPSRRYVAGSFNFPRRISGTTVVQPDAFRRRKGKLTRPLQPVRLEDPRFEHVFEVSSDDQVEARYLLTPAFMERMVALDAALQRFGGGKSDASPSLWAGFVNQQLVVVVENAPNLFEVELLWPVLGSVHRLCRMFGLRLLAAYDPGTPEGEAKILGEIRSTEHNVDFLYGLIDTLKLGAKTRV